MGESLPGRRGDRESLLPKHKIYQFNVAGQQFSQALALRLKLFQSELH